MSSSFLTFTWPWTFSSTSNIARSLAFRQSAVTWIRSNLRRPRVENRSRKAGLSTFWRESLVTSEKVTSPFGLPQKSPETPTPSFPLRLRAAAKQQRGVGFGWRSTLLTAPLAAWLGEHDAPGASYRGRAAGKVSSVGGVVGRVLRGCDNHHHDRQDYRYHSQRDELGRHCVLQEVR